MKLADVKPGMRIDAMRDGTWDENGKRVWTYKRCGIAEIVTKTVRTNAVGKTYESVEIVFRDGSYVRGLAKEMCRICRD